MTLADLMVVRVCYRLLTPRVIAQTPPPGPGFSTEIEGNEAEATSLAGIVAVSRVLLTKVVVRLEPFTCTTDAGMKLVPLRVSVNAPLPAMTLAGERLESVGCGLLTAKVSAYTPPPGPGFSTEIEGNEAVVTSLAGMAAVSRVLLTKVVVRLEPFTCTTDAGMKLVPLSVSVSAPLPAMTLSGERLESVGCGLLTANVSDHIPPPGAGFSTEIEGNEAVATSLAGMAAVSRVLLTKVVVRFEPFTCTTDAGTKLVPLRVNVNAPLPAMTLSGERPERVGCGLGPELLTARLSVADVPPPGAGFATETERVPAEATSVAGMAAVSCVPLTNVVVRLAPLTRTTEPAMKPLPVRVKVKAAPPTETLAGEIFESEGSGLLIVSVKAVEVPPPGAGLTTVIEMVPEEATSLAGIAAVSWVLLTNAVLLLELFTRTTELATKLPPLSVSVNPALPALILAGEILESEGDGLLIVRARAAEIPPPGAGFATVIESVPEEATSLAGIAAVSCVLLTKVVVRFAPLARTTEPGMKPLPVSVRVKAALPAETLTGEIVESEGDGLLIVSVKAVEAPPPGAGFAAVIETVPEEATSLAGIAAVSCVLLTKVVLRLEPFTCTRDPFTKFEPFTVSVKVPLPTTTVAGDRLVSDGTGLLTVKVRDALAPPPGVEA